MISITPAGPVLWQGSDGGLIGSPGTSSTDELPSKDAVGATSLAWCLGRALVSYAQWPQTIIVLGTIAQEHD